MFVLDWFGDVNASNDKNLQECFVELDSYMQAMEDKVYSIKALKGVGKTAFLEELIESSNKMEAHTPFQLKMKEKFNKYFIVPISVTDISFEILLKSIDSIDPRNEIVKTLTSLIKLQFIISLLSYLREENTSDYKELKLTINFSNIKNNGQDFIRESLGLIERLFTKKSSLSEFIADKFFSSGGLEKSYDKAKEILNKNDLYGIIILDEFDEIMDLFKTQNISERFYFHQTVATSLLMVGYSGEKNKLLDEKILFKCLFPQDLYSILEPRDLQKYDKHTIAIRWTKEYLLLFLNKRIAHFLDIDFDVSTVQITHIDKMFEKTIYNRYYNINENIFEYILRHTLFRPRDLQEIMISIAQQEINNYGIEDKNNFKRNLPFKAKSVVDGVNSATMNIIRYLLIEFDTFRLEVILGVLKNKKNIMTYGDFWNLLRKSKNLNEEITLKDYMKELYNIGVIGIFRIGDQKLATTYRTHKVLESNTQDPSKKYYVSIFSFSDQRNNALPRDSDNIVIAPLFYDYLDSNVDKKYLIYPF